MSCPPALSTRPRASAARGSDARLRPQRAPGGFAENIGRVLELRPGTTGEPTASKLLGRTKQDRDQQVAWQLDHLPTVKEALPSRTARPVEALVEILDRALRCGHEFRLAMLVQKPAPIGIIPDPAQVMPHQATHRTVRFAMAVELGEEPLLVVPQALDIERRGQLLLAAEVMIDAADARLRAHTDVRQRRAGKSDGREAMQRRLQDLPLAGVRSQLAPAWRDDPARHARVVPLRAHGKLHLPLHWNAILE